MSSHQTITELFLSNSFTESHKWSHYLTIYEKYLSRFLTKSPVLLEIGVRRGGSLGIWKKYFGEDSTIIGVDIDENCSKLKANGFEIYTGSQSDESFLEKILKDHPAIDIVIDDGSHIASDIIKTFECLYRKINQDAIYIIEDVSAAILSSESYDNSKKSFSEYFQEIAKQINLGFVDQSLLHQADSHAKTQLKSVEKIVCRDVAKQTPPTDITATTSNISFYPNMIVLEKSPQAIRTSLKTAGIRPGLLQAYRSFLIE